jgi:phosphatidylglycerophosphatase A
MNQKFALLRDVRGLIATGFGSGLTAVAPGTFGTIFALPLCYFAGKHLPLAAYLSALAIVFAVGCWASAWVIQQLGTDDPGCVVIDEWVGMALTWIPVAYWWEPHATLVYLLPAFAIFRAADIFKIWPASWADRTLSGGFGAMLDDALAGIWGALLLCVLLYFLPFAQWP